jgi:hypothetical protein
MRVAAAAARRSWPGRGALVVFVVALRVRILT